MQSYAQLLPIMHTGLHVDMRVHRWLHKGHEWDSRGAYPITTSMSMSRSEHVTCHMWLSTFPLLPYVSRATTWAQVGSGWQLTPKRNNLNSQIQSTQLEFGLGLKQTKPYYAMSNNVRLVMFSQVTSRWIKILKLRKYLKKLSQVCISCIRILIKRKRYGYLNPQPR